MIDGKAVLGQVHQGMTPPTWRVFPAKQSHFIMSSAGYVLGALLMIGFIGLLIISPDFVIGLRGLVNIDSFHDFWRVVDFSVAGLAFIGFIVLLINTVRGIGTLHMQALVVLPEGFVMQKGAESKTMSVIEFGTIKQIATRVSNGNWSLVMPLNTGKGAVKLDLDGRFGPPKQIAKMLEDARAQYAVAAYRR